MGGVPGAARSPRWARSTRRRSRAHPTISPKTGERRRRYRPVQGSAETIQTRAGQRGDALHALQESGEPPAAAKSGGGTPQGTRGAREGAVTRLRAQALGVWLEEAVPACPRVVASSPFARAVCARLAVFARAGPASLVAQSTQGLRVHVYWSICSGEPTIFVLCVVPIVYMC